jgi:thiamine-phosphate pyrophosphorylase
MSLDREAGEGAHPRLVLVTPLEVDLAGFPGLLEEALAAGEVAAVILASGASEEASEAAAAALVPIVQRNGAAALVRNYTRVAGRSRADGVHIDSGIADLRSAVLSMRPRMMVGAGNLNSRHAAMEAGEADIDYVLFGRLHGDVRPEPHPRALELAAWWAGLMLVPAVAMAGNAVDSVAAARDTGAEFVALHRAAWDHPEGPAAAVRQALALVRQDEDQAA